VAPVNGTRRSISFDVATDAGASRRRNCGSILDRGNNFPSSPKRPVHPSDRSASYAVDRAGFLPVNK
jgi:hypothetical protein